MRIKSLVLIGATVATCLILAACGGGGGSDGGGSSSSGSTGGTHAPSAADLAAYQLDLIQLPSAYRAYSAPTSGMPSGLSDPIVMGSPGVIAFIDGGFVQDHAEYASRVLAYHAVNATQGSAQAVKHGTHVTGLALGRKVGVAQHAKAILVDAGHDNNGASLKNIPGAFEWLLNCQTYKSDKAKGCQTFNGTDSDRSRHAVVNLSISLQDPSGVASDVLMAGIHSNDWLVVMAAGNVPYCGGSRALINTAAHADDLFSGAGTKGFGGQMLIAGNYDPDNSGSAYIADSSCVPVSFEGMQSEAVHHYLLAPGIQDFSSSNSSGATKVDGAYYARMTGTSMATPVVSGAAALVRHAFPALDAQDVVSVLLASADILGSTDDLPYNDSIDKPSTPGDIRLLNVAAAVNCGQSWSDKRKSGDTSAITSCPVSPITSVMSGVTSGVTSLFSALSSGQPDSRVNTSASQPRHLADGTPEGAIPVGNDTYMVPVGTDAATSCQTYAPWSASRTTMPVIYYRNTRGEFTSARKDCTQVR